MRALMPLLALALVLPGCSAFTPRSEPAPVRDARVPPPAPQPAPPAQEPDRAQVFAYRPAAAASPMPMEPQPLPEPPPPAGPGEAVAAPAPDAATPPPPLAMARPAPALQAGPAAQELAERAETQRAAGDLAGAGATLERALRIEPRNPFLWNRLARVRLEQGQYPQAGSLAAKSSILAGDLPELKLDNQRIIAAGQAGR